MNNKTLFQRDEPLCNFWLAVCKNDNFEKVMAYAMAELFDDNMTSEELSGARKLKKKLLVIADTDEAESLLQMSSGLEHDVLGAAKRLKDQNQEQKPITK